MTTETLSASPPRPRALSLLIISYFAFVAMALPDGILNIAWTYMKDEFNVSLESLGILLGVAMAGRFITSFASGAWVKRFGMGMFLTVGAVLLIIGLIGYTLSPSWIVLLIFVAITAMGAGAIDAGFNTYVGAFYSRGQMNWLHAAYGIGVTMGPAVATFVIVRLGESWRFGFALAVIPLLITLILLITRFSGWTMNLNIPDEKTDKPINAPSLLESLRLPAVLLSGLLFFAMGGVEIGTGQLANTLFVEGRLISQETSAFWISLYWGSFTIGRILMGFVADRISAKLLLRLCMLGSVIGAGMLMSNITPEISFLGITVIGFALAPLFATLISETPGRVGLRHAANAVGIQIGVVGLGGAALPYLAGLLTRSFGLEVIGVVLFISAIAMLLVHEVLLRVRHED